MAGTTAAGVVATVITRATRVGAAAAAALRLPAVPDPADGVGLVTPAVAMSE